MNINDMTTRLGEPDGAEDTLQDITSLAMRVALDKFRQYRNVSYLQAPADPAHVPSQALASSRPDPTGRRAELSAASGWDSDPAGDPFKVDGPDDNLLGDDGEDPFGSWPAVPSEKKAPPKAAEEKESDSSGYIDFSLEGILEEALRVEDQGSETASTVGERNENERGGQVEENAFAGVLEDVLGTEPETGTPDEAGEFDEEIILDIEEPFSETSLRDPAQENDGSNERAEVELVEERFDAIAENRERPPVSPIDDLARTQLSSNVDNLLFDPVEKESTSPELRSSSAHVEVGPKRQSGKPKQVVVPVHLSIAPDTEEVEIEVTLEIKINREEDSF